jgi:hypothetical protein
MARRARAMGRGEAASVDTVDAVDAIARRCRQRVNQRAWFAAGVAMVPVPASTG